MAYNGANISFSSLVLNNNNIFAGLIRGVDTTNGIWSRPLNQIIGIKEISADVPANFELKQNYPNPFNPATKLRIQIAKLGNVRVTVYDITGREISKLVNGQLKPGSYEISWDASNFPSGVYFYRMETDGFAESKKMILLK